MLPMFHVMITLAFLATVDDGIHDILSLVATMESLLGPVEDFQCEFEGSSVYKGANAENEREHVAENGLLETYGGVFVWKQGGDLSSDALHRRAMDNLISRVHTIVRPQERRFERAVRSNDNSIGHSEIRDVNEAYLSLFYTPASFFLLETIKQIAESDNRTTTVTDDHIDGRPLKVVKVFLRLESLPDKLLARYWIDLKKNGHVVRIDTYSGDETASRCVITLKSFRVGDHDVWMPVAAETNVYTMVVDHKPVVSKDVAAVHTIYVIDGTMQFNTHPHPNVFTIQHKPGTPISDHVRKLKYQYEQEHISPQPTKAETEAMLQSQLAKAEAQKNELVAAPLSEGFNWWALSVTGLGAAVLASLTLLWMQRRAG